jgi:hypothetical protein
MRNSAETRRSEGYELTAKSKIYQSPAANAASSDEWLKRGANATTVLGAIAGLVKSHEGGWFVLTEHVTGDGVALLLRLSFASN